MLQKVARNVCVDGSFFRQLYVTLSGPGVELPEHYFKIFFINPGVIGVRSKVSWVVAGV